MKRMRKNALPMFRSGSWTKSWSNSKYYSWSWSRALFWSGSWSLSRYWSWSNR